MTIELITTGGTIDKEYNEKNGELTFFSSNIEQLLKQGRCLAKVHINLLMQLDSLGITDNDRQQILDAVIASSFSRILITHGTDTMQMTAKLIGQSVKDKTVIITGAMIPFSVNDSDALFNLGAGIIAAQTLPAGCYIVMNGQAFNWDNVTKNKSKYCFERIKT